MRIKSIAASAAAAALLAGSLTAPVYATNGDSHSSDKSDSNNSVTVEKDNDNKNVTVKGHAGSVEVHKDACQKHVKVQGAAGTVEVTNKSNDCDDDKHEVKSENTVTTTETAPAATTEQPAELPKTGPANALALGGAVTALGYIGNLLRLRFSRSL